MIRLEISSITRYWRCCVAATWGCTILAGLAWVLLIRQAAVAMPTVAALAKEAEAEQEAPGQGLVSENLAGRRFQDKEDLRQAR